MSPEQKTLVLQSWKQIEPATPEAADLYFKTLFAVDPGLRLTFAGDLDREGKRLFSVISTAVRMLDKTEELAPVLREFAEQYECRGVRDQDFGTIGIALINTLRHQLGPVFDAPTQEAWIDAWSTISGIALESRASLA